MNVASKFFYSVCVCPAGVEFRSDCLLSISTGRVHERQYMLKSKISLYIELKHPASSE